MSRRWFEGTAPLLLVQKRSRSARRPANSRELAKSVNRYTTVYAQITTSCEGVFLDNPFRSWSRLVSIAEYALDARCIQLYGLRLTRPKTKRSLV